MDVLESELEAAECEWQSLWQQVKDKTTEIDEIKSRIMAENQRQVIERFARKRRQEAENTMSGLQVPN